MQALRLTPTVLQMMGLTVKAYRIGRAAFDALKDPANDPRYVDADIELGIAVMDIQHDLTTTQRDYLLGIAREAARPSQG